MPSGEDRRRMARKLALLPPAGGLALAAIGYYPTRLLAGQEGVRAMLLAQALVAMVVLATLMSAMRKMVGKSQVDRFRIAMAAGLTRFLVTVPLLAAVSWRGRVDVATFALWGAASYVVMILLEAVVLARWFRYLESERRC